MMLRACRAIPVLLFVSLVITPAALETANGRGRGGEPPVAIISLPPNNSLFIPGGAVDFDGRRSFDPDGQIASFSWAFGDGNSSADAQANHTYLSPGNYSVSLTVMDTDGNPSSAAVNVLVRFPSALPIKISLGSPDQGSLPEGEGIAFDVGGILMLGGTEDNRTYLWDFGDGTTHNGRTPNHTYTAPGLYNVTLTMLDGDFAARDTIQLRVLPHSDPAAPADNRALYALFAASILLVIGIAAFFGGTELGLSLLFPLFIFLYSRIRQDQILDNYTRGQIHGYIMANPGEHYNSIKIALKLKNGTLAYHLQRLENEKVIKSVTQGLHKRYYPANMKVSEPAGESLTEVQKLILAKIGDTPGISQRDIAVLMNLSSPTVNYHIERLLGKGMIRRERAGMRNRCYLTGAAPGGPPFKEN